MVMGCEIDNRSDNKDKTDEPAENSGTSDTSDKASPEAKPTLPAAPGRIAAGKQVAGDTSEGNGETDNFGNDAIWVDGSVSLGVRCLANDGKTDGMGDEYYCDNLVSDAGALHMIVWPDKTVVALASDFISPESGLVYKFKGFAPVSASSGLIGENPRILSSDEQRGTFRVYWNTYARP